MRKIILDLAVTLDGFIEGPNGEIDWIPVDDGDTAEDFLGELLDRIDTIFYGRVSYDMWGNFVPGDDMPEGIRKAYEKINTKEKVVFSKSKKYDDVLTIGSHLKDCVEVFLEQPGKDIWLYGGGKLITTFINMGLVDEYRLGVYPVILGSGKPLFENISNRVNLKLSGTRTSKSGVVLLQYARV